jgi:hypothetical protein
LNRFARAAIWAHYYTPDKDPISYVFSALNNISQDLTQWNITFTLSQRAVAFRTKSFQNIKTVSLKAFNPHCSDATKMADMLTNTAGDLTSYFREFSPNANKHLIERNPGVNAATVKYLSEYPLSTKCLDNSN